MPPLLSSLVPRWWKSYIAAILLVPDKSYTAVNLAVLVTAYATNAGGGLWAALLTNFAAINTSFHLAYLEDHTVFDKFAKKFGVSRTVWNFMNWFAHVLPLLLVLKERGRIKRTTARDRLLLATGTAAIHLLWGAKVSKRKSRIMACDLSHVYIDLHDSAWKRVLAVALVSHYAGASLLP